MTESWNQFVDFTLEAMKLDLIELSWSSRLSAIFKLDISVTLCIVMLLYKNEGKICL